MHRVVLLLVPALVLGAAAPSAASDFRLVRSVRGPGTLLERTIDRAIKAFNLVAQSGVCTMIVLDLIDVPETTLGRIPRSTWLRLQRVVEGSDAALLLLAAAPVARSAGGLSIATGLGRAAEEGTARRACTPQSAAGGTTRPTPGGPRSAGARTTSPTAPDRRSVADPG